MKKYICPALIFLLMIGIFCFSAQVAEDSSLTSSHFCKIAAKLLFSEYSSWSADTQKKVIKGMTFVIRKAAHFSEYALMGFLWYIWLRKKRWNIPIAFGATALYAMSDEFHQRFVPGRSGEIRDVLVDSSGALFGILAAFVVMSVWHCLRHRDITEKGVWKQ